MSGGEAAAAPLSSSTIVSFLPPRLRLVRCIRNMAASSVSVSSSSTMRYGIGSSPACGSLALYKLYVHLYVHTVLTN